jgi:hypothetical protein
MKTIKPQKHYNLINGQRHFSEHCGFSSYLAITSQGVPLNEGHGSFLSDCRIQDELSSEINCAVK